ncbi:MAG TPA: FMN-binding protein [Clostridiales bacterium]|nr:FMN-binding protein [Clostridiales bacterium]HBR08173.1 FMN-binding protein [Clostridiales bacterium]
MKKIIAAVFACLIVAAMAGCGTSGQPAATAAYSGTQEATAQGMGQVKVTITFENGVVTACDADVSQETAGIGQTAGPTLTQAIVDNNSPVVDGVSGATMTSNAVMTAAKACFDAAGIAY